MQPTYDYYGGGVQPQMETGRPSSRRKVLLIVGILLLLLTIAAGIFASISGGSGPRASAVSKDMIMLLGKGDGINSYELLSADGKQSILEEEWVRFVVANKEPLSKSDTLELVYAKEISTNVMEEGYNIGEPGSIWRVKILVNTEQKRINSIGINLTAL